MIIKSPRLILHGFAAFVVLAAVDCQLATVFAQGTAFTYQGRLNQNSSPANGLYDFQFAIYDGSTQGQAVASVLFNLQPGEGGKNIPYYPNAQEQIDMRMHALESILSPEQLEGYRQKLLADTEEHNSIATVNRALKQSNSHP